MDNAVPQRDHIIIVLKREERATDAFVLELEQLDHLVFQIICEKDEYKVVNQQSMFTRSETNAMPGNNLNPKESDAPK